MVEIPDGAGLALRVAALEAETARLRAQLDEVRQEPGTSFQQRRRAPVAANRGVECFFLTIASAAVAFGLGRARLRALVRIGAVRTVRFPNGRVRVPRSELTRVDEFGLEAVIGGGGGARRGSLRRGAPKPALVDAEQVRLAIRPVAVR